MTTAFTGRGETPGQTPDPVFGYSPLTDIAGKQFAAAFERGVREEINYLEVLLADLDEFIVSASDHVQAIRIIRNRVNRIINQLLTEGRK